MIHDRRRLRSKAACLSLSVTLCALTGCPGADSTIVAARPVSYVEATQGEALPGGDLGKRSCSEFPCCDQCINGVSNCGGPCGGTPDPEAFPPPSGTCGNPGQCPCSLGGSGLVGFCGSRPPSSVCTYCPPGTQLLDPCGTKCTVVDPDDDRSDGKHCPETHPVTCGSSSCCPTSHSMCCANKAYCGTSVEACLDVDQLGNAGSSGGGGGGGACTLTTCPAGLKRASLRTSGCCSTAGSCVQSCADGCGQSWYEARGRLFGPCATGNTSCMQSIAQSAVNACR